MKNCFSKLLLLVLLNACASSPEVVKINQNQPQVKSNYAENEEGQNQQLIDQGFSLYWKGDYAGAARVLDTAFLANSANESWAKYILYFCLMATGDYESATEVASTLVKARPHESMGYEQMGLAQLWSGKVGSAITNFKRALEFESHSPTVNFYIGVAYEKSAKPKRRDTYFSKAEEEYSQILKSNPLDFDSNYELASLYLYWDRQLTKVPDMLKAARESLLLDTQENLAPEKSVYFGYYLPRLQGIFLTKTGKIDEGLKLLFQAINNAPSGIKAELAEIYLYMAKAYRKKGNTEKATGFLEKAKSIDPRGPYLAKIQREFRTLSSLKKTWP